MKKAGNSCAKCKLTAVKSLVLNQPLCASVSTLFNPLVETVNQLGASTKFQLGQYHSLIERYKELEKKYETSKKSYWQLMHHLKQINADKEKYKTKLSEKQRQRNYQPGNTTISQDYGSPLQPYDKKFTNGFPYSPPSTFRGSVEDTPCSSRASSNQNFKTPESFNSASTIQGSSCTQSHITPDGFRIPLSTRVPKSAGRYSVVSSESSNLTLPFRNFKPFGSSNFFRQQ
ncbi:hypothetical protein HCN44_007759 [Aphidius gifuensis]|nr:hypothetical protein HCN44_007759 [Aphidius gifuensis]